MAKTKDKTTISIGGKKISDKNLKALLGKEQKPFEIISASINDDFCQYEFLVTEGVGKDDKIKVQGSGIIEDDMRNAFIALKVHLACIDDIFKHSEIEIDYIEKFNNHDHTHLYSVTGFKVKGAKENESVILIGTKYISCAGGRIDIVTPKIPLDNASSYKWYNELKTAIDICRLEVELYKGGKYTLVEHDEEPILPKINFGVDVNKEEAEEDFTDAKVK